MLCVVNVMHDVDIAHATCDLYVGIILCDGLLPNVTSARMFAQAMHAALGSRRQSVGMFLGEV